MKTRSYLMMALSTALVLAACGPEASVNQITVSDVYTAVAMTVTAQSNVIVPTATVISNPTATAFVYPTLNIPTAYPTATTYAAYSYTNSCDSSAYVSDVTIPDGTELAPGETFVKTWMFKNIGSCTWSTSYSLVFFSGSDMDGTDTAISQSVEPGEEAEISVSLTAPDTEGTYTGYWMLANNAESTFGETVYVQIVVSEDAATLTPTITPTPTPTSYTSTPTTTSTSYTNTPTIQATATSAPTATDTPAPTDTPSTMPTIASATATDTSDN